jgi:PAS domain S-box-containing protein
LTIDRDGTILFINRSLPPDDQEEIVGRTVYDLTPSEFHEAIASSVESVFQSGEATSYEARSPNEYGPLWFTNRLGPIRRNGQVVAATLIATDITDRKRMERALRDSFDELEAKVEERTLELTDTNQELQAIYDGMVDGLLVADSNTRQFVRANPAICQMLGYSADELLAMSVDEIHPREELPHVLEKFRAQTEGRLVVAENTPVLRKDGTVFFADIATKPVTYHERPCAIGFFRDITERKKTQEAILRQQQVLRQLLESSDRDRKLTAYEIHDGLTQHIAGAKMQLEAFARLRNENPEGAEKAFETGLGLLMQGMSEARHLISGLRPPILDEQGVFAAIEHLIGDTSEQNSLEPELVVDVGSGRLTPLLENAIFRIVQESVTNVRRHSRSDKVRIELAERSGQVRIEVQDWGTGFDTEAVSEGCFGLRSIKERAKLLGGRATIKSEPGKGTLVRVELPLVESEQAASD